MKNRLSERIQSEVLLYDGSKGVMLQKKGLVGSESAESYNLTHPNLVSEIYRDYKKSGSDLIQTNTFQANRLSLEKYGLSAQLLDINKSGITLAIETMGDPCRVAVSSGPTSHFFEPVGEMSFENAVSVFSEQAKLAEEAGANMINFETFTDLMELRAAVIGAKESSDMEIIANATFDESGKTLMGNPADVCALTLKALGASIVGANCSGGPDSLLKPIKAMYEITGGPLCVKPNAGMPQMVGSDVVFTESPEHFASFIPEYLKYGVRLIGGCCGSTPEYIAKMREKLDTLKIEKWVGRALPHVLASPFAAVPLSDITKFGEMNFTEKALKDALRASDFDTINDYALGVTEGADCLVIDFSDVSKNSADIWGMVSNLIMALQIPVIVRGSDAAIQFFRYYPGRCGYVPANNFYKDAALYYGALILSEEFRPV
ncbi:MAG: homocysteine S-methyltransferase family protein [Clostridiales bacterium]|nr:homocysteine S-methyltransferase family protein [Clostridiales bacterium]